MASPQGLSRYGIVRSHRQITPNQQHDERRITLSTIEHHRICLIALKSSPDADSLNQSQVAQMVKGLKMVKGLQIGNGLYSHEMHIAAQPHQLLAALSV